MSEVSPKNQSMSEVVDLIAVEQEPSLLDQALMALGRAGHGKLYCTCGYLIWSCPCMKDCHFQPQMIETDHTLWEFGIDEHRFPARMSLDGIPLRLIPGSEHDLFLHSCALYVRTDRAGWLNWLFRASARKTSRIARQAYERAILTLYVWGLADYEASKRPSWRDIKIRNR